MKKTIGPLEFTTSDLKANKNGYISSKQIEQLKVLAKSMYKSLLKPIYAVLGFHFICAVIAFW
ncbi:MAG: hypothetical protein WBP45_05100 [Daejeonella sp.]